MSQLDFENLEVTDEVGEESSEEIIEIETEEGKEGLGSRYEKKSDDLEKGDEEKKDEKSSKKLEKTFELRNEIEAKGSVGNAEDVWVKTVRYLDDTEGVKKGSAKESTEESEEEKVLIERLEGVKRKRKENMEEETQIAKDLFKIHEREREAAREEQLKKKKEEDERKKKFKPEEKARQAYEEVMRMAQESERLLNGASEVSIAVAEASKKAYSHWEM
jgi:hypothetical protein